MKEITRCVVGFRKRYNFEVRWVLSQGVTKQINDLLFSWFRIGKHRVPEAVIVVGAVAELTSTEQRAAASLLLGSTSTSTQRATSNEQLQVFYLDVEQSMNKQQDSCKHLSAAKNAGKRPSYQYACAQCTQCSCTMHTMRFCKGIV